MCKSRTGSGKTLAFAIPIIEALDRQSGGQAVEKQRGGRGRLFSRGAYGRAPRAICVAPTRELAKQVRAPVVFTAVFLEHSFPMDVLKFRFYWHVIPLAFVVSNTSKERFVCEEGGGLKRLDWIRWSLLEKKESTTR